MPRRLTLHIGSHKTGTTSLQKVFLANKAALQRQGLTYVHGATSTLHKFVGMVNPPHFLPGGFKLRDIDQLVQILDDAPGPQVFASSENFSFLFLPESVETLARILRPRFDEIRILVYLRRQDRQIVSHHQEGAKPHRKPDTELWGHALTAIPPQDSRHALYLDYDRRLGTWADVFGQAAITIRVFDRKVLKGGDLVTDVLGLLGLDPAGLELADDRNLSLSALQARLGHMLVAAGVSEKLHRDILLEAGGGPKLQPSRSDAMAFYDPWRDSNARLNARFGVTDLPFLFDDDFDDYPEVETPAWDLAESEQALAVILRTLGHIETSLRGIDADELRAAAMLLRGPKPQVALRLARVARDLRPKAVGIQNLVAGIEDSLARGKKPRGPGAA